jgi:pimeloyl-ACP methyl ester carboxylesterase
MLIPLLHRLVQLRLKRLGLESKLVDLTHCRIHLYFYRHPSSRSSLVLLHGIGTSSSTWYHLYPSLMREHSIFAIDLPGFGFSTVTHSRGILTLAEQVLALEECIERLELPQCTLLGHSLGGWIAAKYATRNAQRIEKLVLINPAGVFYEKVEELKSIFTVRSTAEVHRLVRTMWYRYPWYVRPLLPAIKNEFVQRKVPEHIQSIRREDFLGEELRQLTMPVQIVWGIEDRLLDRNSVALFQERVQQLEVIEIDACGHVPQLECPRELKKILQRILQVD